MGLYICVYICVYISIYPSLCEKQIKLSIHLKNTNELLTALDVLLQFHIIYTFIHPFTINSRDNFVARGCITIYVTCIVTVNHVAIRTQ